MAAFLATSSSAAALGLLRMTPRRFPSPSSSGLLPTQIHFSLLSPPRTLRPILKPISSPVVYQFRVPPFATASFSPASAFLAGSVRSVSSLAAAADFPRNISTLAALAASAATKLVADAARSFSASAGYPVAAAPLAVALAAGVSRWLDLYREVLLVRCLLSWFPNLRWEWQPFSAIRNISDPYLGLFRSIVPPVLGGTLDVSSLVAFVVLGMLASLLNTSMGGGGR